MGDCRRLLAFGLVFGLAVLGGRATAQAQSDSAGPATNESARSAAVAEDAQRLDLATAVVAQRESASARRFDAGYRAQLTSQLAQLDATALNALLADPNANLRAAITNNIGDTSADLVYTPVAPCRVFDTRFSVSGILAANTQQNFTVTGTATLAGQGGSTTGCGIPLGRATSVIINFAAVSPSGAGNLRAWAVANPQPAAPLAAVMNFSPVNVALANGVAVPLCDPAVTSCAAKDLRLQADASSVHVVGDVLGYFARASRVFTQTTFSFASVPAAGSAAGVLATRTFTPEKSGTVYASSRGYCNQTQLTTDNGININAGTTEGDAFASGWTEVGVLRVPGAATPLAGTWQGAWTSRRAIAVTAGVAVTLNLYGKHEVGAAANNCSGTFTVEGPLQ